MADKKKNTSQSPTRNQSQASKAAQASRTSQVTEPKASSDGKEQSKAIKAKAVAQERDERKVQESKTVRRENKGSSSKGPATWQVRLRSNRTIRFLLDSYYELRYKVTWPSFIEARNMTIAVLLLSGVIAAILGLADLGLSQLYQLLIHIGGK